MSPGNRAIETMLKVGRERKRVPRVKLYEIVARAVEEGAAYGVRRAYKYTDAPTHEALADEVACAVIAALCEVVDFGA